MKQTTFIIYKATHIPTGKFYIGFTQQLLQIRMGQHWGLPKNKWKTFNTFLHSTEAKDWDWTVLQTVGSYVEARDCEIYYINLLNAYKDGLNETTGGRTEEQRAASGRRLKDYRAENVAPWNKGRKGCYSEETLNLMRLAKLKNPARQIHTEESRAKKSLEATNNKEIVEVKTGQVFRSINDAARQTGLKRESIRDVVNGRRTHTGGRVFKRVEK